MRFERVSATMLRVHGRGYVLGYMRYKEDQNKAVMVFDCEDAHLDADSLLAIVFEMRKLEEQHGT